MENPTVSGLRSRSRSNTPFLRSSCDRESCMEDDHSHQKSGRRTPIKRSTPIKQLGQLAKNSVIETVEEEQYESAPAHRTRLSTRTATEKLIKTSDYSSEESLDRLREHTKEMFQNELNSQYERVSTSSQQYSTLADVTLSPIHVAHNVTNDRSTRFGSPSYSVCSTDSSFAEQALADASALLDREHNLEHLPYRLYKMAGEYWNKYPKTDYTYSPLSRDRVELAPGQIAVPNMSRRSLSQFRVQGPITVDEPDRMTAAWTTSTLRKRFTTVDSSDDECTYQRPNGAYAAAERRWWISRFLSGVYGAVATSTRNAYRKVVGPSHRYPYTERRPAKAGLVSRAASAAAVPFYWIYTIITTIVTTTVTTITETLTPRHEEESEEYVGAVYKQKAAKRRLWPWLLLLLLPPMGYGLHHAYENFDDLALPNFTDFQLELPEFAIPSFPEISVPNICLPSISLSDICLPNVSLPTISLPSMSLPTIALPKLPEINLTLPRLQDVRETLPEVGKVYREYKEVVQNRMDDAAEYVTVVADSCWEELRRYWRGVIG